ncbi:MAG: hypothetical protein HY617_01755, partial [Candidatus Sungbacteria bacterium]|nr:hypothetical protein [Candidatus Sungbacteria bacterium]
MLTAFCFVPVSTYAAPLPDYFSNDTIANFFLKIVPAPKVMQMHLHASTSPATPAPKAPSQASLLSSFTSFFSNDTIANFFLKIIPSPSPKPAPKPSTPSLGTSEAPAQATPAITGSPAVPTPPAPGTPTPQGVGASTPSPTIITRITERILQPITQITKIIETTTIDNTSLSSFESKL